MEKTEKIAARYGVPMPRTCISLDWQTETKFFWGYYKYDNPNPTDNDLIPRLLYNKESARNFVLVNECHYLLDLDNIPRPRIWEYLEPDERYYDIYPAPQLNELINSIVDKEMLSEIGQYVYEQHDNIAEAVAQLIINNS